MSEITTHKEPEQYLLDLRLPQWIQLELDLDYPVQPNKDVEMSTAEPCLSTWGMIDSSDIRILPSSLEVTTFKLAGSAPPQSRLTIVPELIIDMPRKPPNALVRFFHKHLFNFTWKTL